MGKGEDRSIVRAITAFKVVGGLLFLAVNGYLLYRFSTAYSDGQQRGEILQREKEERKKEGKEVTKAPVVPEEVQPEYVEKQVRKYKQVVAAEKKVFSSPSQK
jgi:hypothetical protein